VVISFGCSAPGSSATGAGTVHIHPNAKTGAHHHGELESVIYVVSGRARMRWGERLEFVAEADAGDFIFIPPYVPHQEINASSDEPLECVVIRSDNEAVVVNRADDPATETVTIAGKYCESGDILVKDAHLPPTRPGDVIALAASGAYCLAMASNYNMALKPAVVALKDGQARLIRRRETYADLLATDVFAE